MVTVCKHSVFPVLYLHIQYSTTDPRLGSSASLSLTPRSSRSTPLALASSLLICPEATILSQMPTASSPHSAPVLLSNPNNHPRRPSLHHSYLGVEYIAQFFGSPHPGKWHVKFLGGRQIGLCYLCIYPTADPECHGHCEIAYDTESERLAVSDFYDFSSSYPSLPEEKKGPSKGRRVKVIVPDMEFVEDDGWEDV